MDYINCDISKARKENSTDWTLQGLKIEYCLSQLEPSHCRLDFSLGILGAVIAMNFCKCASMFWTLWRQKEATLVTFGDAVSTCLDIGLPRDTY